MSRDASLVDRRDRQQSVLRTAGWGLALVAAIVSSGCGGGDDNASVEAPVSLTESCAKFKPASLPHGGVFSRTELRAATASLPEVCIVRGTIVSSATSTINWAVELPAATMWNGKTITFGGGGFDGFIPTDVPSYHGFAGASANSFVKISSDSGHQAPTFAFAVDDVALRNHAYQANHFSLEVGTVIATEFYGRAPTRRYMFGGSNGGRAGLAAAQRYPGDYDGIVALVPAPNQTAMEANVGPILSRHIFSDPSNWLNPAKVRLYANAEIAACDALDGLADGIIGNIEACQYVPSDLLCPAGVDNDQCLTAGQIETVRLVYADKSIGMTSALETPDYPRYGRGGAATPDWNTYLFGSSFAARDAFNFFVADEMARVAERSSTASAMTHDPTQFEAEYARVASILDSADPDLRAFADQGGKMIIWHGVGDTIVSVYRTAAYVESVKQLMGESQVARFARFFSSPGVGHGSNGPAPGGPGAAKVDWVTAIDVWVEKGDVPDGLVK